MQKQHQILKQKFKLSPQQIQFLGLLAIPLVDLEKRIEEEIEENPTLEESDATDSIDNKEENFHYKNKDSKQDFIVDNLTGNINSLSNFLHKQLTILIGLLIVLIKTLILKLAILLYGHGQVQVHTI